MTTIEAGKALLEKALAEFEANQNINNANEITTVKLDEVEDDYANMSIEEAVRLYEENYPIFKASKKRNKALGGRISQYVEEHRKELLQNGKKSYQFPNTAVQAILSTKADFEVAHGEMLTSDFDAALIAANPKNASAISHSISYGNLERDHGTTALLSMIGLTTHLNESWQVKCVSVKKK